MASAAKAAPSKTPPRGPANCCRNSDAAWSSGPHLQVAVSTPAASAVEMEQSAQPLLQHSSTPLDSEVPERLLHTSPTSQPSRRALSGKDCSLACGSDRMGGSGVIGFIGSIGSIGSIGCIGSMGCIGFIDSIGCSGSIDCIGPIDCIGCMGCVDSMDAPPGPQRHVAVSTRSACETEMEQSAQSRSQQNCTPLDSEVPARPSQASPMLQPSKRAAVGTSGCLTGGSGLKGCMGFIGCMGFQGCIGASLEPHVQVPVRTSSDSETEMEQSAQSRSQQSSTPLDSEAPERPSHTRPVLQPSSRAAVGAEGPLAGGSGRMGRMEGIGFIGFMGFIGSMGFMGFMGSMGSESPEPQVQVAVRTSSVSETEMEQSEQSRLQHSSTPLASEMPECPSHPSPMLQP